MNNSLENLDASLRAWALTQAAEEHSFPVLINASTLRQAEYPEAFPHLLMAAAVATDPGQPFVEGNLRLANWFLSPAVCYHAYAALSSQDLVEGRALTARGCCFRNEDGAALAPGRRQIEFQMRELIFVGAPEWIDARLAGLESEVAALASACGLKGRWQPANDPFFLPRALGKSRLQRLLGTKLEFCLPDDLAVASINRHGAFFGERFAIRAGGHAAHSACLAFGLDRWAAHAANQELTHNAYSH